MNEETLDERMVIAGTQEAAHLRIAVEDMSMLLNTFMQLVY